MSVRSAGFDGSGRSVRPDALVIDLTPINTVKVDGLTATVAGGATAAAVIAGAQRRRRRLRRGRVDGHPPLSAEALSSTILFPGSQAEAVLSRYADVVASAADDLTVGLGLFALPDGASALSLAPT